jgi:hypothetical protein
MLVIEKVSDVAVTGIVNAFTVGRVVSALVVVVTVMFTEALLAAETLPAASFA